MGSKSAKQLDDLSALLSIASDCDAAAISLGMSSRALYSKIAELRTRNGNRGPGGSVVAIAMEKIAARHLSGSCLHLRRAAHPAHTSFKHAVEQWLPSLTARPVLQPISPPSAEKAA
jgi:hypothetical protein